jgi:hypothetical protein
LAEERLELASAPIQLGGAALQRQSARAAL